MTPDALADLRLDLRDLAGVVFVATRPVGEDLALQVVVDDPSVVPLVESTVEELARRHGGTCVELEVSVAGARRSELLLDRELRSIDGVRDVTLGRGPRGELLQVQVVTSSPAVTAQVERLLDRRLGRAVRVRRAELVEAGGAT